MHRILIGSSIVLVLWIAARQVPAAAQDSPTGPDSVLRLKQPPSSGGDILSGPDDDYAQVLRSAAPGTLAGCPAGDRRGRPRQALRR